MISVAFLRAGFEVNQALIILPKIQRFEPSNMGDVLSFKNCNVASQLYNNKPSQNG